MLLDNMYLLLLIVRVSRTLNGKSIIALKNGNVVSKGVGVHSGVW